MKIDPRSLIAPLFGLLVLVLIVQNTMGALRASGSWQSDSRDHQQVENPYATLDAILSRPQAEMTLEGLRDPFGYGTIPARVPSRPPVRRPTAGPVAIIPVAPVEPPPPSLTAIIWDDNDPRATVRWDGRDFSVRANSVFADFTVKSIRPTDVVLERGGQQMVLRLSRKGDSP